MRRPPREHLRALLPGALALALAPGCATQGAARDTNTAAAAEPACVTSLAGLLPRDATSFVLVRPRALFEHPRLGRALARAFDDATEEALLERARRVGYDLRTLDRALLAWGPRGTVAVALGAFDGRRITDLLWERLLTPRARGAERGGVERMEGTLVDTVVAVAVHASCGVAAWAEGDTRLVDRVLLPPESPREDPSAWVLWRTRELPPRAPVPRAVFDHVRWVTVRASPTNDGVRVSLHLDGALPEDTPARLRATLRAVQGSPLGESVGAPEWLHPDAVPITPEPHGVALTVDLPWRAVDALAEALRGDASL
ncbi:MAG: hypothetical protein HY909_25860 [Deltaproteobacteria bacterium]|nr:hypothetical protein [Deltaproteobacteria bacterium]